MKKLSVLIVFAAFMILTTGCGTFYTTIDKDTVMVKKINNEDKRSEVQYEAALSQDTAKTLSVKAVNKYFNENFTVDKFKFELMVVDQNKLKDTVENSVNSQLNQKDKEDFETELNKVPDGLFYLTLTGSYSRDGVYDVVLNARTGDVLKIFKYPNADGSKGIDGSVSNEQIIKTADRFIQAEGSYAISDLTMDLRTIRSYWAEVYYRSNNGKSLKYHVIVQLKDMKVLGFNKDLMAMLNYYTGITYYQYYRYYQY
ncbi:hypothetical protein [Paenibacillus sp. OAS669]|uniref:hypothetical protein n=1 Tax=Paenibacillus sp. OAS669 TaxID=2663821 RepID=UPI00178BDED6|nr:hypothetical protein [Paenibacillus sp. OAS669]MBE1443013.1 hypothetical protein [Paenibacillus sp. OAS669]